MDTLTALNQANPHIPIHSVHDAAFLSYGRVISADTAAFCTAAETAVEFPTEGSKYLASVPELESLPEATAMKETFCGQLDEQLGLCLGHSNQLNALEWHTCNEFNIAVRELVLLLAKRSDMDENNRLDANNIKAFYLAQGDMVEIYADTLHFCPCEVTKDGFSCIVGLQRGTNLPLENQKQGLLWAKNKWLLAHEANASLVQRGGYPGIYGENWVIYPVDRNTLTK